MTEASVFTQIRLGKVPGEIIYQDDLVFAIMTIAPHNPGHCMIIPVEQTADFEALPVEIYHHLMDVAQQMARILKKIYSPPKVALAIVGMEVAHVHVHLFPLYAEAEMNPAAAKHPPFDEIAAEAKKIRQALSETPIE